MLERGRACLALPARAPSAAGMRASRCCLPAALPATYSDCVPHLGASWRAASYLLRLMRGCCTLCFLLAAHGFGRLHHICSSLHFGVHGLEGTSRAAALPCQCAVCSVSRDESCCCLAIACVGLHTRWHACRWGRGSLGAGNSSTPAHRAVSLTPRRLQAAGTRRAGCERELDV